MSSVPFGRKLADEGLIPQWEGFAFAKGQEQNVQASWWRKAINAPDLADKLPEPQQTSWKQAFYASLALGPIAPTDSTPLPCDTANTNALRLQELTREFAAQGERLHKEFSNVLAAALEGHLSGKLHAVYLQGPAGCGKSHLIAQVTRALALWFGREVKAFSMCASEGFTAFDYLGSAMPSTQGNLILVDSAVIQAYSVEGDDIGVLFIDEFDLATSSTNKTLNPLLEGDWYYNPATGRTLSRPKNLFFFAAGNSNLYGPTQEYNASQPQDGSVRSRFAGGVFIIGYDEQLERDLLEPVVCNWLHQTRRRIAGKGLPIELSTRLGLRLSEKLKAGFRSWEELRQNWVASLQESFRTQVA